ncbi:MAG: type A chloramphenicol O-acetyltransferase [Massiliimalia sp.]|jgi:chloramphenicol O-acetyltransferase type A
MMEFHKIELKNWNRSHTYEHFMTQIPCTYSMCVNLDITHLLQEVRRCQLKFFPIFLYGLSHVVNQHTEFRMDLNQDSEPGYYSVTHPYYTVLDPDTETFFNLWTCYDEDIRQFYANYLEDQAKYGSSPQAAQQQAGVPNLFNVSCIPWVSFTGFNLNIGGSFDYLPPIFTVGKYFEQQGQTLIPLSIQVHHAVCDGFHTSRFVNELQQWADSFCWEK